MASKKILITAALPYANGPLHFGHMAGAYLPADVFARFQRMQGQEVLFISGSDEYGLPITFSAEKAHRSYQEHVDFFHEMNRSLFEALQISFDHYSRTTIPQHTKLVQDFFLHLYEQGYIEKKEEEHLFSPKENRFLADRYVVGTCPKCLFPDARGDECPRCAASYEAKDLKQPRSKLSGAELILKKSTHWYLRLDLFKPKLLSWIETRPWKEQVLHFAKNYISELKPRAITRDSSWGVPVPLEEAKGKVFYVWFDAPIGYISATQEWAEKIGNPEKWKEFWLDIQTLYIQFIGKDNIPFHAAFFPAMIMGQKKGYKLVDILASNEFFLLEGKKFSKSEGWYVDLAEFLQTFDSELLRYTLCANAPEQADADFHFRDFQRRGNRELLGKFGNFIHRCCVFCVEHLKGEIPKEIELKREEKEFIHQVKAGLEQVALCYQNFSPRRACIEIMQLAQQGNHFFDQKKPWKLLKEGNSKKELVATLYASLKCAQALAIAAFPILPKACQKIWKQLGFSTPLEKLSWEQALSSDMAGQKLNPPHILFQKIEDAMIEKQIQQLGKEEATLEQQVSFEDFAKLELVVAEILTVEKVEKSKKLLKLEVDIGEEKRVVVSGIAPYFSPQDLIGKKVVFVANLKPAKIMGIESQGMILAAEAEDKLELPTVSSLPVGSKIR